MTFKFDKENELLIVQEATRIEYHQLELWLKRKVKGWKFQPAVKMGVWDGSISYFDNGKIPMGLWKECLLASNEIEVPFKITNKEDFPIDRKITHEDVHNFCVEFFKGHKSKDKKTGEWKPFFPHDYQIETAYKILKNKFCLGEVATSGGKSLIISIIFFYILKNINPDAKFLLIVPSISLVTQMYENFIEYNLGDNVEIGYDNPNKVDLRVEEIMSEKPRKYTGVKDANIYIGTYQSLINWPKEWFQQFYGVVCDESHQSKAASLQKILKRTFGYAQYRFGVSGTFPPDDSCEILTIQSVMGPRVSQIEAKLLVQRGNITPMKIKALLLNYNELELNEKLSKSRTPDNGRQIYEWEKKFIQSTDKKVNFIKKLVEKKCNGNTLVLFHTIEYGQKILEKITELDGIDVFYIDGEVSGKKRDLIFNKMDTIKDIEYTILDFGTYQLDVKSDFKLLLSDGTWKTASQISKDDDIDDDFLKKIKKNTDKHLKK